ncbi:MAG: thioesterase [Gammaproteobacteria bacterium SG8_30]|jgi:acyl-CoA thioester hydrolase|nr:MAG: thioesterase [Gammaproteobacteria bacterium SG8_30]
MRRLSRIAETLEVDVAFHDVDMMGVVWHGQYLRYLENARWALMNRIGYGFEVILASGFVWPVIECHVRYVRPARFGDRLSVQASLVEWENRLAVNYLVADARTGERVARGRTVQVAVDRGSGAMQFASPPDFLRAVRKVLAGPTEPPA